MVERTDLIISDIIALLPYLFDYVIPGFIFFGVRRTFFPEKKTMEKSILYIIVCSAIIKTLIDAFISILPNGQIILQKFSNPIRAVYIVVAIAVSVAEYVLRRIPKVSAILSNHLGIAARPNVWLRFIGTDGKTYLTVTTDTGEKIFGSPQFINEDYIVLMPYIIEGSGNSKQAKDDRAVILPCNKIKRMETAYDEGSEILKINQEKQKIANQISEK